jgi:FtsP/CotA-like multicopper oxidase with cupredoxin domain
MMDELDTSGLPDAFPQAVEDLPDALPPAVVSLKDRDVLAMKIAPVRKRIGNDLVRMLAYNGSIPGPVLKVRQGTTVSVEVSNDAGLSQTVHWHGLRLENRFDGVPYETQEPIPAGGRFNYELQFPDPGLYWYHPHIREDYGQELGLYGQIIVDPADPNYWPPVNREITLTLDDILLEDGRVAVFHPSGPTHTMMGRFGNVFLANGDTDPAVDVTQGEVVRLYLTNTANTRPFNIGLRGLRLKLVGGDSGRYEREQMVDSVILSPSERAVVDVMFDNPGQVVLENRTPRQTAQLVTFVVKPGAVSVPLGAAYVELRTDPELTAERAALAQHFDRAPDKTLQIVGEMDMTGMDMADMEMGDMDMAGAEMTSMDMGDMDMGGPTVHDHHRVAGHADSMAHEEETADGIEWEDTMPEMNLMSSPANMVWKLVDVETGAVNQDISWRFKVGERVKIRLDNSLGSDHQMQHPFHIHGAGRFLVLNRGTVREPNLVWKDTVLVRAGEIVDILFDVTSPGRWMAHCHIAEHNESGMMFSFDVLPQTTAAVTR